METLYFADPAGQIAFEKFVKKFLSIPTDENAVSEALASLQSFFDVADNLLQKHDFMAGDNYTLIDIYYIPLIQRLVACGYGDLVSDRQAVSSWWDRCMARSAVQEVLQAANQR